MSTLPRPYELVEMIDRVLSHWAFLPVSPAGMPAPGPADLPLEFSVHLSGRWNGVLVLRSSDSFGAELAYACTGDPGAREQGADAFQELCNLAASHLLSTHLGGAEGAFAPFLPKRSQPGEWPQGLPNVECVMIVEGQPLELRLWAAEASHV